MRITMIRLLAWQGTPALFSRPSQPPPVPPHPAQPPAGPCLAGRGSDWTWWSGLAAPPCMAPHSAAHRSGGRTSHTDSAWPAGWLSCSACRAAVGSPGRARARPAPPLPGGTPSWGTGRSSPPVARCPRQRICPCFSRPAPCPVRTGTAAKGFCSLAVYIPGPRLLVGAQFFRFYLIYLIV